MSDDWIIKYHESISVYVIIFDLCSSSQILESLENQNKVKIWNDFWEEVYQHLHNIEEPIENFEIYKFVGDGFIILCDERNELEILSYCHKLTIKINTLIQDIIEEHIETEIDRVGITIGIDYGKIVRVEINKNSEYTGKAINIASRLQSSLKEKEHANKMLISKKVKNRIANIYDSKYLKSTDRILHNLHGNARFYCFEIDLMVNPEQVIDERKRRTIAST